MQHNNAIIFFSGPDRPRIHINILILQSGSFGMDF